MRKSCYFMSMIIMMLIMIACSQEALSPTDIPSSEQDHIVSLEKAKEELLNLLAVIDDADTRGEKGRRKISQSFSVSKFVPTKSGEQDSIVLYVFNFEDDEGYALMLGDSRWPSLLTITESGHLNLEETNEVPSGVVTYYNNLDSFISDLIPLPEDPIDIAVGEYNTYGPWENIVYRNKAYCKVKWNQDGPYNNVVKETHKGVNVLTGCVATATAQLMSIYKYPPSYGGQNYDWDSMTQYPYADLCSATSQNQIATLMYQLGISKHLNVDYGTEADGGSSADPKNIPRTLVSMGYSSGGELKNYNTEEMVSEIKNGYPILVGGASDRKRVDILGIKFSYIYSGGHRWLVHGLLERRREVRRHNIKGEVIYKYFESVYYPQCNWGWTGTADGYYLSEVFDSTQGPIYEDTFRSEEGTSGNYQYNITMVSGIRK